MEIKDLPNFRFVKGDIQSPDLMVHILQSENIDTVMHFAAQTHVDNSFGNSLAFTLNNAHGTHVLLEACRVYGQIRRFINVSTDEVYGETSYGKEEGLTESSRLEPTNPYSSAKAGAELIARAYYTSYRLPVIVTRGNNVYGPHQFPEKMIPKFILRAVRGLDLPIHGDGQAVRSYLYVDDVADAFLTILRRGKVGSVYNIGTEKERSIVDVANDISLSLGLDPKHLIRHVNDRPFNDRRYFISTRKLSELGWIEKTSWQDGLNKTVEWYTKVNPSLYWDNGSIETALDAHPQVQISRKATAPYLAWRRLNMPDDENHQLISSTDI